MESRELRRAGCKRQLRSPPRALVASGRPRSVSMRVRSLGSHRHLSCVVVHCRRPSSVVCCRTQLRSAA